MSESTIDHKEEREEILQTESGEKKTGQRRRRAAGSRRTGRARQNMKKDGRSGQGGRRRRRRPGPGKGLKALAVFAVIFFALSIFLLFATRMLFDNWAELTIDEIMFHLKTSIQGTDTSMVRGFVIRYGLPAAALVALLIVMLVRRRRNRVRFRRVTIIALVLALLADIFTFYQVEINLGLLDYFRYQGEDSTFVEDNYVDPAAAELTFPEKKRNLIYIYLESMEATYADEANGGAFPENIIPELTALAQENEDFSGPDPALNGGECLTGTTWTMAGLFGQSAALPLKSTIGDNEMDKQDSFFPGITTLGDILEDNGYEQYFLLGSDVTFGGRKLYYRDHGNFHLYDYYHAVDVGWIPEGYVKTWGFEDEKLFTFARETLTELAAKEEPFNLTLLTVDTHFEDGFVCDLCREDFGDNQYANVMACSSRQVTEFVRWCQEQDFYENTTIILSGDHTTMDHDFCDGVPADYTRRTYTCYINPAAEPVRNERRTYSTMDNFPTTLAALGVEIKGDRLGLGTNLFSDEKTLLEQYSKSFIDAEFNKHSEYMDKLMAVEITDSIVEKVQKQAKFKFEVTNEEGGREVIFYIGTALNRDGIDSVEVYFWTEGAPDEVHRLEMEDTTDYDVPHAKKIQFSAFIDLDDYPEGTRHYEGYINTIDGQRFLAAEYSSETGE